MSGRDYPKQMTPEQSNTIREQQIINARILALKYAQKLATSPNNGSAPEADRVVAEAKKIEAYLLEGIDALKPKSAIVVTTQMPPSGAGFKPGD